MKLVKKTPQKSLDTSLLRFRPKEPNFLRFKTELSTLLGKIDVAEREDNQEIHILNFLRDGFYRGISEINKKGTIDLAIHLSADKTSPVGVIVETKRPGNKGEMLTAENPNTKALQELVLYFMRERVEEKNDDLKYLVATNINEWFIFAATDFNRHFYENKRFRKAYEDWQDKLKISSNTPHFYNEIAKPFIDSLDETLECTYFDLRSYCRSPHDSKGVTSEQKELVALYKLLSPYHLLKTKFVDDSNALDKKFYTELLHIIGLEEYKEKSKTLIRPKVERSEGSLIEKAIAKLETEYFVIDGQKWKAHGATKDEQIYNVALELCIVWVNRILFLKLLEAQLLGYHEGEKSYRFLDAKTVNNFNELYTLFHDVLNCNADARRPGIAEKYIRVPYLNSSLFVFADVERDSIKINALDDNANLNIPNSSILKKLGETAASLPTLEYLFRFLDAYDFASEGKEEIQKENRSLINASVLGKVFEKINGYKDGSIYTPGFITMYMCRQAIRLAVLQKFKDIYKLEIESFEDLYVYVSKFHLTEKILEFNAVIDSLKICDPAVGSGHFLVSALNEILAIKSELEIFADETGKPFGRYSIAIANDELVVTNDENVPFEYKVRDGRPLNAEMQRLQSTLFHEKQKLIENCLFGVDINPNSVKICRLRLWIELLKNAYYKSEPPALAGGRDTATDASSIENGVAASATTAPPAHASGSDSGSPPFLGGVDAFRGRGGAELETLPNIDINIKEGNSLISRFKLQDKFKSEATNKIIKEYRALIDEAKNVKDTARKDELKLLVLNHKKALSSLLEDETTEIRQKLDKKHARINEINHPKLFEKTSAAEREMMTRKIQKEIDALDAELSKVERRYDNSFEWRYEFPEVLDDDGNFLGFDIVIGNPPYIRQESLGELKEYLMDNYEVYSGTADILVYFYEAGLGVLKENGRFSMITANKFMRSGFGKATRRFLSKFNLSEVIDFADAPVFGGIAAYASIVSLQKHAPEKSHETRVYTFPREDHVPDFEAAYHTDSFTIPQREFTSDTWRLERMDILELLAKLHKNGKPLGEYFDGKLFRGIITGINEAFVVDRETRDRLISEDPASENLFVPFLRGRDVSRWTISFEDTYLIKIESSGNANHPWTGLKGQAAESKFTETYPAIYSHFQPYRDRLIKRDDKGVYYWELRACVYWEEFWRTKLIYPDIYQHQSFAWDEEGYCAGNTCYFIPTGEKWLTALLNSKTVEFFYSKLSMKMLGGYMRSFSDYMEQIPIPKASENEVAQFVGLIDRIMDLKKSGGDTTELENRIDEMVFDLYELTEDEKQVIRAST